MKWIIRGMYPACVPSAPGVAAPSTSDPIAHSQPEELGRVGPLSEFGDLHVEIEEVIRDIPELDGVCVRQSQKASA